MPFGALPEPLCLFADNGDDIVIEFDGQLLLMLTLTSYSIKDQMRRDRIGPVGLAVEQESVTPDPTSFEPPCPGIRPVGNPLADGRWIS